MIVYDIARPYSSLPAQERCWILTTTSKPGLDTPVGESEALEIIGKPYDLQRGVTAVGAALDQAR